MDAPALTLADADRLMGAAPSVLRPLRGPPTVGDSIRDIANRTSGGFVAAHDRWVVEARIELTNRSRYEHKVLSRALQLGFQVDVINFKRSVAFEYLNRRRQLLEEAHRDDPARPNFDNAHVFMGEDDEASGTHLSSALMQGPLGRGAQSRDRDPEGAPQGARSSRRPLLDAQQQQQHQQQERQGRQQGRQPRQGGRQIMKATRGAAMHLRRWLRLPPPGSPLHVSRPFDIGGRISLVIITL